MGNRNDPPSFQNYGGGQAEITRYNQAIIPSYEFTCCGDITEWRVDLHPGGRADDGKYTLNLQVWRPSPTVDDSTGTGNYNLVGNNRFTEISLSDDGAIVITPSPSDHIQFRPGDVLGFHVENAKNDNAGLVVVTTGSFTSERVWHASVSSLNENCPVSAGSGGVLNTLLQGAPVIEIDTGNYIVTILSFHPYIIALSCRNIQLSSDSSHPTSMSYHYQCHVCYSYLIIYA